MAISVSLIPCVQVVDLDDTDGPQDKSGTAGILRDKTMDDELIYFPNNDE